MPVSFGEQIKASHFKALADAANAKSTLPTATVANGNPNGGKPYIFFPGIFFVASQAEMLQLGAADPGYGPRGIAIRTDTKTVFQLQNSPHTTLSNWLRILGWTVTTQQPTNPNWNPLVAFYDVKTVWRLVDLQTSGTSPLWGGVSPSGHNAWTAVLAALWRDIKSVLGEQESSSDLPREDRFPTIERAFDGVFNPDYGHGYITLRVGEQFTPSGGVFTWFPRRNISSRATFVCPNPSAHVDSIVWWNWTENRNSLSNLNFVLRLENFPPEFASGCVFDMLITFDLIAGDIGSAPTVTVSQPGMAVTGDWFLVSSGGGVAQWRLNGRLTGDGLVNGDLTFTISNIGGDTGISHITFGNLGSVRKRLPPGTEFGAIHSSKKCYEYPILGCHRIDADNSVHEALKVSGVKADATVTEVTRLYAACSDEDGFYAATQLGPLRTMIGDPSFAAVIGGQSREIRIFAGQARLACLPFSGDNGSNLTVAPADVLLYPRLPWRRSTETPLLRDYANEHPGFEGQIRTGVRGLLINRVAISRMGTNYDQAITVEFGCSRAGAFEKFPGSTASLTIPSGAASASQRVEWFIFTSECLVYRCAEEVQIAASTCALDGGSSGLYILPLRATTFNAIEAALARVT